MSAPQVLVRDRATGTLVAERVFSAGALRFLYEHPVGRLLSRLVTSAEAANHVYGWLQRAPWTRRDVPGFVERLGIDPGEAERPLAAYASLDDFFTRRLRPGTRPIDPAPGHLVSPADGRALAYPDLGPGGRLAVKGCAVTLRELVGDARLARRFAGGPVLVVRLAPADYHRFHFPDDGLASPWRALGRRLESVHPFATAAGAPSFRNKRALSVLETARFGPLLLVEVGALLVGTIVQTYRPGPVRRGQEKGLFRFGGSTVVLVGAPGRLRLDEDLVLATRAGHESFVRVGARVGATA